MSWGYPMRFRLSSVFLMIALVAVLLAWYVDHRHRRSDNIVGVWYYPDRYPSKGRETLTISRDGTFTHEQATWGGLMTSSGTYTLAGNGIVEFHVASKRFEQGGTHPKIDTLEVDRTYRCRIARDSYANLIVVDLAPRHPGKCVWKLCRTMSISSGAATRRRAMTPSVKPGRSGFAASVIARRIRQVSTDRNTTVARFCDVEK